MKLQENSIFNGTTLSEVREMSKRVALIIAEQMFRDEEYQVPKEILMKNGMEVLTVSTKFGQAIGSMGMVAEPDLLLSDLQLENLDGVVFVGGMGSQQYFDDPTAHQLAQESLAQEKILGAICIAPVILARAGVLAGKKATVYPDGARDLKHGAAEYTASEVEVCGNIITGNGPEAAERFGEELVKLLL